MRKTKTYFRRISKTGKVEELPFILNHLTEANQCAGVSMFDFDAINGLSRNGALELVNKWNKQSNYSYWIA